MAITPSSAARWLALALALGLCAVVFIELTHGLKRFFARHVPRLTWRMALGGTIVALLGLLLGPEYLGLGVPTIQRAFVDPALPQHAFAAKLLLTAVTLGTGFLGGEVTPLFFIGATLGNTFAQWLGLPLEIAAGVGLAALFGSAANTPVALAIMAGELLGAPVVPYALPVTCVAWLCTGHRSIYASQRHQKPRWRGLRAGASLPPGNDSL